MEAIDIHCEISQCIDCYKRQIAIGNNKAALREQQEALVWLKRYMVEAMEGLDLMPNGAAVSRALDAFDVPPEGGEI